MRRINRTLIALALLLAAGAAWSADLRIGRANEPQSIDPQFSRTGPNQMTAMHIFDRLVVTDENLRTTPGLAESWRNLDPKTWEVKLRRNVKFHDGTPFTAEDVVFSFERAPKVPNSPASFADAIKSIAKMQIVDPHTIRFTTKTPDPLFIENIGTVFIVCKKTTVNATSADFNSGKAANGTGAYKFIKWSPGDRLDLVRNDDYWGTKPEFEKVMMKFISNDAARTAALLSDSVDLIDLVPPADIPKLKSYANLRVYSTATVRLIYVGLNQRPEGPFITDLDGKPLGKNPLTDPRVRKALSLMIDRNGLVNRILYGSGEPAAQLVPPGVFGYDPKLMPPAADIKEARRLLAEAGYTKGFGITLHSSNDRFLLDREVAQALGQLFARGGIKVNKVETLPYSVYAKEARRGTYGLFVFSYGNVTGESSRGLSSLLHTFDKAKNVGTLNRSLYSNPKFDALLEKAMQEFDAGKREKMLQEATELVFNDTAMIPLYWQSLTWAAYKGITYKARRDERTLAMSAAVAK